LGSSEQTKNTTDFPATTQQTAFPSQTHITTGYHLKCNKYGSTGVYHFMCDTSTYRSHYVEVLYELMHRMVYKLFYKKAAPFRGNINTVRIIWTSSDYFETKRLCFLNMNCHTRWKILNKNGLVRKSLNWICEKYNSVRKRLEVNPLPSMVLTNVHTSTTLPASTGRTAWTKTCFRSLPSSTSLNAGEDLNYSLRLIPQNHGME
jgi:hypothetical protein